MSARSRKISIILIFLTLSVSLAAYFGLPEQLTIHIDGDGRPNGFAPKWIGAWLLPLAMLLIHVTRQTVSRGVPAAGRQDWSQINLAVQVILAAAQFGLLLYNYGHTLLLRQLLPFTAGALLVIVGNLLFRLRSNLAFGIRNKWTLSDPQVWRSAHRFAGVTFIATGLLLITLTLLHADSNETFSILIALFAVNHVAAYLFYRQSIRH